MRFIAVLFCVLWFWVSGLAQDSLRVYTKDNVLTSNEITSWRVDSKGIVWIGTTKGLNAFAGNKWYQISQIEDNASGKPKPLTRIETIFEDRDAKIWVGTSDNMFVYNHEYWIDFINTDKKKYSVKQFYQDRRGWVWTMLEYFQDLSKDLDILLLSGTLHMFDGSTWYEFDSDLAGTASMKFTREALRYFTGFIETESGDIWVSTLDGLFRFNGESWNELNEHALSNRKTYAVIEDRNHDIWVASENGISRYSGDKQTNYGRKDGLSNSFFYQLKNDPWDRIWAYVQNSSSFNGVNMFDGEKWLAFNSKDMKIQGPVIDILFVEAGAIVFSASAVSIYREGNWQPFNRNMGLKDSKYSKVFTESNRRIWLTGDKCLYTYNDGRWETQYQCAESWEVEVIFIDRAGNCWVGTKKSGVFRQTANNSWVNYHEGNGLSDDNVNDIFEDKDSNVWVLTRKGLTVFAK